ncbi:MAG: porin family protein [Flavobacterium sp.]|nr:porin family protein [Flavobacterium sp.]
MKKLFFSAAAILAFGLVSAQDIKFGAKAGFASLSGKLESAGVSATGSDSGFFVGGFAEIPLSETFAFKPELLYVAVGDVNQVQVPLHLKYTIAEGFGLLAGPNLAFITGAEDGMKSFNYGVDFGASYDITETLVVDARYNLGLANLLEDGDSDNSYKISGFYVGLGYRF